MRRRLLGWPCQGGRVITLAGTCSCLSPPVFGGAYAKARKSFASLQHPRGINVFSRWDVCRQERIEIGLGNSSPTANQNRFQLSAANAAVEPPMDGTDVDAKQLGDVRGRQGPVLKICEHCHSPCELHELLRGISIEPSQSSVTQAAEISQI
jgi:hypothetical protein